MLMRSMMVGTLVCSADILCGIMYVSIVDGSIVPRKCVNYIRSNSMIPIISTHHGYYVSNDKKEIQAQTDSLLQRAQSIINSAKGLQKFLV